MLFLIFIIHGGINLGIVSRGLLASISLTFIFAGVLPLVFNFDFSNYFILAISGFTFIYTIADFVTWKRVQRMLILLSVPLSTFFAGYLFLIAVDSVLLNRLINFFTLVSLGLSIYLISERDALDQANMLSKLLKKIPGVNEIDEEEKDVTN